MLRCWFFPLNISPYSFFFKKIRVSQNLRFFFLFFLSFVCLFLVVICLLFYIYIFDGHLNLLFFLDILFVPTIGTWIDTFCTVTKGEDRYLPPFMGHVLLQKATLLSKESLKYSLRIANSSKVVYQMLNCNLFMKIFCGSFVKSSNWISDHYDGESVEAYHKCFKFSTKKLNLDVKSSVQ